SRACTRRKGSLRRTHGDCGAKRYTMILARVRKAEPASFYYRRFRASRGRGPPRARHLARRAACRDRSNAGRVRSVAVVVLAVHDVRAPWELADVRDALDRLGLAVDDVDAVVGSAAKIELLVRHVRGRRLQEQVVADLDPARRLQRLHIEHVDETGRRADDERLAGRVV